MYLTSHLSSSLSQLSSASAFLGSDHPLTRTLEALATVLKQSLVVALLLSGAIAGLVAGERWALQAVIAAALVQAAFACAALLLGQDMRALVLDLIIEGRGDLPLPALARQRKRLLQPGTLTALAARIEQVLTDALTPPRLTALTSAAAPIAVREVASLEAELRAIAVALGGRPTDPRGVALVERLLRDGRSGVYGGDASTLREEVNRALFLLCCGRSAGAGRVIGNGP